MSSWIEKAHEQAKQQHPVSTTDTDDQCIDVQAQLIHLLHTKKWSNEQWGFFHGWMKKLDVAKKHYVRYKKDWKLAQQKIAISQEMYQLSLTMALAHLEALSHDVDDTGERLKTCNVIYKIIDLLAGKTTPDKKTIYAYLDEVLAGYRVKAVSPSKPEKAINLNTSTLPITVLFWEGPIARAYLATMRQMGFKVKKIIQMVSSVDLIKRKPVGRFLPPSMRTSYAANKQYKQIFYWPNQYKSKNPKVIQLIQQSVEEGLGFKFSTQASATENHDLQTYTEELETLSISGLKNKVLAEKLNAENSDLFLFTGGGIVPDKLLTIDKKRLIHVHPGYLPYIRGADCVLWSKLLANRLSASAFFLSPGIDVGDIILPAWLPDLNLKLPKKIDIQSKYRMIYGFLDPWVRSYVLKQAIYASHGLRNFNTTPQQESEGMTYHFMHKKMKEFAFI